MMHDPFNPPDRKTRGVIELSYGEASSEEFGKLAKCYHAAARATLDSWLDNSPKRRRSPDTALAVFPSLFMYRHALELSLKGIVVAGDDLLTIHGTRKGIRELYRCHELLAVFEEADKLFQILDWSWDFGITGFRDRQSFGARMKEFDQVDSGSFSFRYPETRNGGRVFTRQSWLDVEALGDQLDAMLTRLVGLPAEMKDEIDFRLEGYKLMRRKLKKVRTKKR